jgi:hypothetical protein
MASEPAGRASAEVHSWEYTGSEEHEAGTQRAVRGDVIHDEHAGFCNFISLCGESPKQIHVVVTDNEADTKPRKRSRDAVLLDAL